MLNLCRRPTFESPMSSMRLTAVFVAFVVGAYPAAACAQTVNRQQDPVRDTTVSAGTHYHSSGLHRFVFGSEYRDLWRAQIRVPILNLETTGGGLTPTTAGGGFQTKSLRFLGNDGLQYGFRSVDKDLDVLPPGLEGTIVERLVQDQTSSAHPAGPALVAPLMRAAGILHSEPQLVVLPDDPALGEFRERFAGTLGFFEQRAITEHAVPFAGAVEILDSDDLFARVRAGSDNRIDARALLAARLLDLLIGDWDRHRGQWTWARFGDESVTHWLPIPEDRDQAFVRFDGLLLSIGRFSTPQLVNFGDRYPNMLGLTWNGRELDRWILSELEWQVWDSVATSLKVLITDAVIDSAVAQMPGSYRTIDGMRMAHALKRRRDRLGVAAERFYRLLAREVDIHGTDAAESVSVERRSDGSTAVTLVSELAGTEAEPFFRRVFVPDETSELRIYMHGGDDRAVIRGKWPGLTVRFIGGAGEDVLMDSSQVGGVKFYTDDGDRVEGLNSVKIDRRTFVLPPKHTPTELPPRNWGRMYRGVPWASFGPDVGLFVGGGAYRIRYGFRHLPYASRVQLRAGYSTGGRTGRFDLSMQLHRSNSRSYAQVDALASGIEVLRFFGFGNEIVLSGPNDDEYYRVNHTQYSVNPSLTVPFSARAAFSSGPIIRYSSTIKQTGRYLETMPDLYGTGKFGQIGWRSRLTLDTRDVPAAATRGVRVDLEAGVFPGLWDVRTTYAEVHGSASTYLSTSSVPMQPTLALRMGGKNLWGEYPFHDAAYIGDASSVRLGRQNRYGGDASVYANAELRVRLSRIFFMLPGHIGLFGLGDIGRVFLDGESSDRWHNAVGGGVWVSFLVPANTLSIAFARSEVGTSLEQRNSLYIQGGFAF